MKSTRVKAPSHRSETINAFPSHTRTTTHVQKLDGGKCMRILSAMGEPAGIPKKRGFFHARSTPIRMDKCSRMMTSALSMNKKKKGFNAAEVHTKKQRTYNCNDDLGSSIVTARGPPTASAAAACEDHYNLVTKKCTWEKQFSLINSFGVTGDTALPFRQQPDSLLSSRIFSSENPRR